MALDKRTGSDLRDFKVVGTRPIRPDGIEKVTGRARFGADMNAPGMLIGRILRSPHAHARIRSIDTSKAEALPGVKAVVTRADFPEPREDLADILDNCMAGAKALYDGHAVAAVAAVSAHVARKALKLIEVDYEVLPHVTDVDEAMRPDAPALHEGRSDETVPAGMSPNVMIKDLFGNPITTPILLDGDGQPLVDAGGTVPLTVTPVTVEWRVYEEKEFTNIPLLGELIQ